MKRIASLLSLSLALLAGAAAAQSLTVSGTVNDSAGAPVPGVRVEVYDEDLIFDDFLEAVYTNAAGAYSGPISNGDDVYVIAKWSFQLQPSAAYNDHVVHLVDRGAGGNPFVATTTFTDVRSATTDNVAANLTINLAMGQAQPVGLATLVQRIQQTLDYIRANRGAVAWAVDYDITTHITTDGGFFVSRDSGDLYVGHEGFDGTGTNFDIVSVFHEMGHVIHYRHNHNSFPGVGAGCGHHSINSEEDPGCALVEGYPSYIGQLTAETVGVMDPFYRGYRDDGINTVGVPANGLWRGDDAAPTGRDGGRFESGEVIEGAFAGAQFGIHGALGGFATNFKAMVDHRPDNAFEFLKALVDDAGGAGAAGTLQAYGILQTHGIVYHRARFAADPFDEQEPPDQAPSPEGNRKEINHFMFLRGKVKTKFEEVGKADLGVADTVSKEKVRVGYKAAGAGLADAPTAFANFTPAKSFGFFSSSIDLDTKTFGGATGDGDWDLLIQAENEDQFRDNFLPTWVGDGNPTVNTDELYLKILGAWYDKDRNPATNNPQEGMVIIDNTAPKVSNFEPHP